MRSLHTVCTLTREGPVRKGVHKVDSARGEESSTGFGRGYSGNVTYVVWQVKLCDPV